MDYQFRSAAFGGFHKQDVLDFLQLQAQELQKLQQQLEQAQAECARLKEENGRQAAQAEQAQAECARLREENERQAAQAGQAKEELEQLRDSAQRADQQEKQALQAQLEQAQLERDVLREQVDAMRPDAEAFTTVKERIAGVELDAHRRAQLALDEAQEQSKQMYSEIGALLSRMGRQYAGLRSQVDTTVSSANEELQKTQETLAQISAALEQQDAALEQLVQAHLDRGPVRVPAPMPIPEE